MTPFPRSLRLFTAGLSAAAALAAFGSWQRGSALPLVALGVFVALEVFTEQRVIRLSATTGVSPGIMVCMASVVVFAHYRSPLGPMIVVAAACAAKTFSTPRGYRGWLPFNAANFSLATLAAFVTYGALPSSFRSNVALVIVAAAVAHLASCLCQWIVIGLSFVLEGSPCGMRELLARAAPAVLQTMPFAVIGFFLGRLYLSLGPAVMLLIIVPILIAREMFASYIKVKESHEETVQMLVRALEAKDRYTAGHAERVANYARYIGEELDFMPARLERLRFAALMHDIGKLVVPNQLLNKPGKLTAEEFARIRVHEKVSVQMLSHIDFLRPIATTSHSDHTRFDPDNPRHPIDPYIVMIADAFDAMTSTRAYRKALPQEVAFQELRDKSGVQFHPECVEALIRALDKRGEHHGRGHEDHAEFDHAPEGGLGSAGLGDLADAESPVP